MLYLVLEKAWTQVSEGGVHLLGQKKRLQDENLDFALWDELRIWEGPYEILTDLNELDRSKMDL